MKTKKLMPFPLVFILVWFTQVASAQTQIYDDSDNTFSILVPTLTVLFPNGGENWNAGTIHNITWNSAGAFTEVNIDYSIDNGTSWLSVAANTANDGTYAWTVPATLSPNCLVRIKDAVDGSPADTSNAKFSISSSETETVSIPNQPTDPTSGLKNIGYSFSSGGSTSNLGHAVQYKFDWDDGSDSGWLAVGTASASHAWVVNGTYYVKVMARCSTDTAIESLWSEILAITIGDNSVYYNSPASRLLMLDAVWALASGGGEWISEVQITDVSGGSIVQVYYSSGASRLGPFTLWSNAGGANSSISFVNILQAIDNLDGSAFAYYGTSGALEFFTQDASHLIQASARTVNGNFARTFPALADVEANTAIMGRSLLIPNISNNTVYRASVVLFNPGSDSVTMEGKIVGGDGVQIGSTFARTLAANQAGVISTEVRADTYSNANVMITVTAGSGRVMAAGFTANNVSNDPAAHIAVQAQ
jgi:hypothetical protein